MKQVTKEIVEKALSMRRDYTIKESAELLDVRAEELMSALTKYVEGDGELPQVVVTVEKVVKKRGRKSKG
jgi:hypothetical protein